MAIIFISEFVLFYSLNPLETIKIVSGPIKQGLIMPQLSLDYIFLLCVTAVTLHNIAPHNWDIFVWHMTP